ncbi:recA bacterial DNA recombination protein-domain-containing protein [Dunaliella salina]|uniref:RecA bacterial DNA recombination protein-domain-containing protein n=1 Tax=Dunaliella salina TaxID=3046 RepID=A0ABQ7GUM5_DUNSA|nr:recA bacterial DNA recombination protein-domain-containing protein [Dunaliella salina]|eukprot:KAF5838235.1 recA bacterial DNA recombination protein-domain-containing protein [Dunaliella salina]
MLSRALTGHSPANCTPWQPCGSQPASIPAHLVQHRRNCRLGRSARREEAVALTVPKAGRRRTGSKGGTPTFDPDEDNKQAALEAAIRELQLKHGKTSIMRGSDMGKEPVSFFSSGSLVLDAALGGGIPRGRVMEIYGPESSGKTTVAMHAIAEMQKLGENACLIDAEHAFDPTFAEKLGVNVDNLFISQPTCGEEAMDAIDAMARSGAMGLVVVDSVSALVPRAELEGEIGAPGVGLQARLMSQALRRVHGSAYKNNCTVIFINQIRMKVGVLYGNPETTSGGMALKFFSSVRLDVRKKENVGTESPTSHVSGIKIRCKVQKNKVAPPFR